MSKVYVLQIPNRRDKTSGKFAPAFDVTPATEFGEIEVVMPPTASFHQSTEMVRQLRHGLKNYDPKNDYILLSGAPILQGVAGSVLREITNTYKLLSWDRQISRYIPMEVTL